LRLLTKDPELADRIAEDYANADLDERERAMLDFALKVTRQPTELVESDLEPLRRAGWTEEDIMDIGEVAAMFNFTNRLANAFGWVPNPEFERLGR
jgi:uncharacterized peroxidase-related enzyme